ncbi:MAG: hypothetical protein QGG67_16420, partial [Gammaproteobacteria bacterium]|nr:hypothetical protein [Gammaproteobacteria bacterium]
DADDTGSRMDFTYLVLTGTQLVVYPLNPPPMSNPSRTLLRQYHQISQKGGIRRYYIYILRHLGIP